MKIGRNPSLKSTEHENTNHRNFESGNSLNSKVKFEGVKMTIIDLEYVMDKNWPKSFPETF